MDGFIGSSSLRWVVGSEKGGKTDAFNFNDVPIFNFNNNTAPADAQAPTHLSSQGTYTGLYLVYRLSSLGSSSYFIDLEHERPVVSSDTTDKHGNFQHYPIQPWPHQRLSSPHSSSSQPSTKPNPSSKLPQSTFSSPPPPPHQSPSSPPKPASAHPSHPTPNATTTNSQQCPSPPPSPPNKTPTYATNRTTLPITQTTSQTPRPTVDRVSMTTWSCWFHVVNARSNERHCRLNDWEHRRLLFTER